MNPETGDFLDHLAAVQVHDLEHCGEFRSRPEPERSSRERLDKLKTVLRGFAQSAEPCLTDIANASLALCNADSAGVSIEATDAQGSPAFQWAAVSGKWASFRDVLLPRAKRLCQVSLDTMRPQHVRVSSEYFMEQGLAGVTVTDGISVPWSAGETRGTVWILAHERNAAFVFTDYQIMQSLANLTIAAVRSGKRGQKQLPEPAKPDAGAGKSALEVTKPLPARLDKAYLFKLKAPQPMVQMFIASAFEIHDDQLALLNVKGDLVALIVLDIIEGWYEVNEPSRLTSGSPAGFSGHANFC